MQGYNHEDYIKCILYLLKATKETFWQLFLYKFFKVRDKYNTFKMQNDMHIVLIEHVVWNTN